MKAMGTDSDRTFIATPTQLIMSSSGLLVGQESLPGHEDKLIAAAPCASCIPFANKHYYRISPKTERCPRMASARTRSISLSEIAQCARMVADLDRSI